jgi:hypothetical protein
VEDNKKVSATATGASAGEALTTAEGKARELLKVKFPDSLGAVGTVGWEPGSDGSHTVTVSLTPADFPDGWDPDGVVASSRVPQTMRGKKQIENQLIEIISPVLAECGFSFASDKLLFSRRLGDQLHCVHLGVHRRCFSLSTRLYLDEIAEFYLAFDNDPRMYRQLSTLNEVFRDFDYPDGSGDTASDQASVAAAARDIVVLLNEHVIPWFDDFPSLILVKRGLERQEHNAVKHENLLPILFLLGDKAGLDNYLNQLLDQIKATNQPKSGQFSSFYQAMQSQYSDFFPPLPQLV